ncbi:AI-2E family transporter [Scatolibacter rhodanostii]|uniref:AI-2E family transporter n=1 Tax=Scatolibacter rhodanostii TaxID=2014781 RepID=UPI000C078747|nr:AI-2E family transporter [Scatolibacter rhodanostii]
MFNTVKTKSLLPILIFALVYTVLFLLFRQSFFYISPFLFAFIIAFFARKPIALFKKTCHLKNTVASAFITGLIILIIFSLFTFLIYLGIREAISFLGWISSDNFAKPVELFSLFTQKINSFFNREILKTNMEELITPFITGASFLVSALNVIMETVSSIPTILTWLMTAIFASFVFSRHLSDILSFVCSIFSENALGHLKFAVKSSETSGKKSFFSYAFLYFIAFCESLIVTTILGIDYPVLISFIICIADILPILGPGLIYVPLAAYYFLLGHYGIAIGLMIGFILVSVTREIIEPKLVAESTKIPALAMIAAVYFSLLAKDIWVMFYVMGLFMFYSLFRESGALPPLSEKKKQPSENAEG